MRPRTWRTLRAALFEATFVVLGIVLALAANDWYEARQRGQRADAALNEIVRELEANRARLEESRKYHDAMLETLIDHSRRGETPSPAAFTRGFVSPAQLSRTAWESASETGTLAHMDYATVLRLSAVYDQADRYEDQARSIAQILYEVLYREGPEAVVSGGGSLTSLISTFAYRERELGGLYAEALAELRAPGDDP